MRNALISRELHPTQLYMMEERIKEMRRRERERKKKKNKKDRKSIFGEESLRVIFGRGFRDT